MRTKLIVHSRNLPSRVQLVLAICSLDDEKANREPIDYNGLWNINGTDRDTDCCLVFLLTRPGN